MILGFIDVLNFVMLTSFVSAVTISLLLYISRRSSRSLSIAIYFMAQIILELVIRTSEVDTPLTRWWNANISSSVQTKGICCIIIIVAMLITTKSLVEEKVKTTDFIIPVLISVFMMMVPSLQHKNMIFYCCYFLPYELYCLYLAISGMKKIKKYPDIKLYKTIRQLFLFVILFSIIIVAEDFITAYIYGFFTDFSYFTSPDSVDRYIKERSFSESIAVLLLAVMAIVKCGKAVIEDLSHSLTESVIEVPEDTIEPKTDFSVLADALGLSIREKEVLPLLLENLSLQKISEELFISVGTVKSHAHNIYQKADVSDRASLIQFVANWDKNA